MAIGYVAGVNSQDSELGINITSPTATASTAATTATTGTTTSTTDATADWKTYTNEDYNFSLTFNDLWKNYTVVKKTPSDEYASAYLYVCVPTNSTTWQDEKSGYFCPFAITVVTVANQSSYEQAGSPVAEQPFASDSSYAFYTSSAQDFPDNGASVMNDARNMLATFKATN